MTLEESMDEALRRLGKSDKEIKERMQFASWNVPGAPLKTPIPKGKEEAVIAELIKFFHRLNNNPQFAAELIEYVFVEQSKAAENN